MEWWHIVVAVIIIIIYIEIRRNPLDVWEDIKGIGQVIILALFACIYVPWQWVSKLLKIGEYKN